MPLKSVLVCSTSKQTTELRSTAMGLECHLEDRVAQVWRPQGTLPPDKAQSLLNAGRIRISPSQEIRRGRFDLGPKRNRLYSKRLFPEPQMLHDRLRDLLETATKP